MKNLFLALALMLVGTFAFGSNTDNINYKTSITEDFGRCTVTIVEDNGNGTTTTTVYSYESSSAQDCFNSAQAVIVAHFA